MRHSAKKHCLSADPRICFLSVFCLTCAAYVYALVSKRNRSEELQRGNSQRDEGREERGANQCSFRVVQTRMILLFRLALCVNPRRKLRLYADDECVRTVCSLCAQALYDAVACLLLHQHTRIHALSVHACLNSRPEGPCILCTRRPYPRLPVVDSDTRIWIIICATSFL